MAKSDAHGTLVGIATREKSRAPMVELAEVEIDLKLGLVGDSRGKPGPRQVTVLSSQAWAEACSDLGVDLPWTCRRANLLVAGVALPHRDGDRIRIGSVILEVTGETTPCQRMEERHPGLREALRDNWRGGVSCRVISGGTVRPGIDVEILPQ